MADSVLTGERKMSLEKWAKKHSLSSDFAKALSRSIEDPEETPYLLERLRNGFSKLKGKSKQEVRNALLRVQIHCSIHGNSDPIQISKQLFISQVLERLFFGSNLLLREEEILEEEAPVRKKAKRR